MATYTVDTMPRKLVAGDVINCDYSGTAKSCTLPKGTYKLECWGAQGGNCDWSSTSRVGGRGGYSVGTIGLNSATAIFIYSGGQGQEWRLVSAGGAGFNGGGNAYSHSTSNSVGAGGGASDIRVGQDSLYARVIVAGGGGGAGHDHNNSGGYSYGGGLSGGYQADNSSSDRRSNGGTQTSGGATTNSTSCQSGSFGKGGNAIAQWTSGGGSGWYGGSGCHCDYSGGGSGYVYTSSTASNYPSGCLLTSDYYLTDAQTIAGNQSFTSPSGTSETGHSGNGYVRITVISSSGGGGGGGRTPSRPPADFTPDNVPSVFVTGDKIKCAYTGTSKSITLPPGQYKFECWGAQGNSSSFGGKGGYSIGTLSLQNNTALYIYTGGQGTNFNGGGTATLSGNYGSYGGDASDIRIGSDSLYARVIVAGGGGGGDTSYSNTGGYGGGISGGTGEYYSNYGPGHGGSQTSGGSSTTSTNMSQVRASGFGVGASSRSSNSSGGWTGGAGGGGWYGGGYGGAISAGGGGSGYVYTSSTASNYPSGCLLNSDYYLTDAQTIAGNQSFPSPTGGTETGHSGDGYILITVLYAPSSGVNFRPKINSTWIDSDSVHVKINGTWIEADAAYVKIGGVWIESG